MSVGQGGATRFAWILALALALGFLAADSRKRLESIAATSAPIPEGSPLPAPDPASRSGFAGGQHRLILPAEGTDGYHWILQTEAVLAGQGFRVRTTDVDNAPAGREVHWSSLPRWWLATLASARAALRPGLTAPQALEQVAAGSGPLALALLLCALTPVVAGGLGGAAAAVFALAWVSLFPLYEMFVAGVVDHHGLAAMAGSLGLLLLVAGGGGAVRVGVAVGEATSPPPDERAARRWFAAAAVAGGVGLWVSAVTTLPVVLGTALGVLLAERLPSRGEGGVRWVPGLWRLWGGVGCATSLAAYALEYAPGHLGWRLEVNHPVYALAWLGVGDLLARRGRRVAAEAVPGLLLALSPAVALLIGGSGVFRPADPLLASLHATGIREFKGLVAHLGGASPAQILWSVTLLPLVVPALGVSSWRALGTGAAPRRLAVVVAPAAAALALALWQVRWLPTAVAVMTALLVTIVALGSSGAPSRTRLRLLFRTALLVLLLAPFPLATALIPWRHGYPAGEDGAQMVARDLAHHLRGRVGAGGGAVVLAPPMTTTWLAYFGGFQGLGTLYWENLEGLRATREIASAPDEAGLLAGLTRHGVTYLVLPSWEALAAEGGHLARILAGEDPPASLVEVPYRPPIRVPAGGVSVRVFEVVSGAPGAGGGGA